MIISRVKNQAAVRNAARDYAKEHKLDERMLLQFAAFLATRLLVRVQSADCYFIDMLEDIERMEQ